MEEARKVLQISAASGLAGRIRHVMIPGMIEEDDDRPIEMKPKLDVLDYWSLIKPELPGLNGLCTQVTAFMDEPALRRAADRPGRRRVRGHRVRRGAAHHERRRRLRRRPTDALSIYREVVDNRGVDPDPDPRGRAGPVRFQVQPGRQLRHDPAAVLRRDRGFLADFAKNTDHRPEILLSFGFVPKVETRVGLIDWLIQDPGNAAVADEQEFVRSLAEPRTRRQAAADGRPVQAGDRRRRRSRLPAEHPLRGDLRRIRAGLRDVRRDARLLVSGNAGAV